MENIKLQIRIGDMGYIIEEIKYIKKGDLVLTYEVENDNSNFIYDVRTGNVHVFPKDKDISLEISERINNKLYEIRNKLCIMIKERYREESFSKFTYECEIRINKPRMFKGTKYEKSKDIYSYLSFKIPKYDLNFQIVGVKFIKERKSIIDVYMCEFQFIVIDSKKSIFQYPHSLKQGKSQSFESYYYNPECKFDNNIDDICSEFLELVNSEVVKREKSN